MKSNKKKKKALNHFVRSRSLRNFFFFTLTFAILFDAFFIPINSDLIIFSLLFLYIVYIRFFKVSSKRTFTVCVLLLVGMFFSYLITNTSVQTEKLAVWLVLFIGIGIIQQWRE